MCWENKQTKKRHSRMNSTGEYSEAEESHETFLFYHMQNATQKGLKT